MCAASRCSPCGGDCAIHVGKGVVEVIPRSSFASPAQMSRQRDTCLPGFWDRPLPDLFELLQATPAGLTSDEATRGEGKDVGAKRANIVCAAHDSTHPGCFIMSSLVASRGSFYCGSCRMRQTALAIISSSSVRITRTVAGLAAVEITGALPAFRASSNSTPRKRNPMQSHQADDPGRTG
jgi:hypothetical protein